MTSDKPNIPPTRNGTGALADYVTAPGWDPYEDEVGPMYWLPRHQRSDAAMRCAMKLETRHCNKSGSGHGGLLVAFADFSFFMTGCEHLDTRAIPTITLSTDFCGPAVPGDILEATAEIVRETGSMLFMRGRLHVGENPVATYSGIVKKPRSA